VVAKTIDEAAEFIQVQRGLASNYVDADRMPGLLKIVGELQSCINVLRAHPFLFWGGHGMAGEHAVLAAKVACGGGLHIEHKLARLRVGAFDGVKIVV
jgi:hypothetical protein